jgi:hypothetical protein
MLRGAEPEDLVAGLLVKDEDQERREEGKDEETEPFYSQEVSRRVKPQLEDPSQNRAVEVKVAKA